MIILKKNPSKDFVILNLTDPQLDTAEWGENHTHRKILEYTVTELMKRAKPDLITVSGDLAWAGQEHAYSMFASFMESLQTPWAIVWGNHDNQNGPEFIEKMVNNYLSCPHFLYEKGDPALGNGNYVIGIEENGNFVEAIIMMDSHNQDDYVDKDGSHRKVWSKLIPEQIDWLRAETKKLQMQNCKDAILILHIPIYGYLTVANAAYETQADAHPEITVEQAANGIGWKKEYAASTGVQHEAISCFPEDDGVFSAILEDGLIRHIIAGHDHVNSSIIRYQGVDFIYGLKVSPGCYWEQELNGGTVIKINQNGVYDIHHEYVDVSKLL